MRNEPPRRPRIGLYCPGNGTGGPWRYVHSILDGLDAGDCDVILFSDLPCTYVPRPGVKLVRLSDCAALGKAPTGSFRMARSAAGWLNVRDILPNWLRLWAGFLKDACRLAQLLRLHPVDLFHTQNTGCEESPVAARLAGIRRVTGTFHVDSSLDLHGVRSGPSHRLLEHLSNRCLTSAIAVSQATKRDWVSRTHIPGQRVMVIRNGIDPDRFRRRESVADARRRLGLPLNAQIVGGVGRLDEAKGFEFLLEASARLRPAFPDLHVVIAGAGPLRRELEMQAERFGMADRVRLLGFQLDVQPVLDALDVFAMPSLSETLGYALLEAMATELPAIGAAVGGIPEVIVEGETGFVVPPRHPVALAGALRTLLLDVDLRSRMGHAGRERVIRHFHERDMVRRTIGFYRKLLG